jgi:hypothetical protein
VKLDHRGSYVAIGFGRNEHDFARVVEDDVGLEYDDVEADGIEPESWLLEMPLNSNSRSIAREGEESVQEEEVEAAKDTVSSLISHLIWEVYSASQSDRFCQVISGEKDSHF